jgi:tungstate transport system permease protein
MEILQGAIGLILSGDPAFLAIVSLSLKVSLTATLIAAIIGIPLGASLAIWRFRGRGLLILLANSFMALPPVVVGLLAYMMLSRAGPLGELGLLFTPSAMIIAQTILITPIMIALTREAVLPIHREYRDLLLSVNAGKRLTLFTLVQDARFGIATALLAGFGRAVAEVGAVLIVGGNIDGVTRVMTTTIALETSKGNLELALSLGIVLIVLAIFVNAVISLLASARSRYEVAQ